MNVRIDDRPLRLIAAQVPTLTVRHRTTYRYRRPVAFGEHRMMLRPRDSQDQRQVEATLDITPAPVDLRWMHDVFGNNVAIARFGGRARELTFLSTLRVEHRPQDDASIAAGLDRYAETHPFSYDASEIADLHRLIERAYPDPTHQLDDWVRSCLGRTGPTATLPMLAAITHRIHRQLTYQARHESGIQPPVTTLRLGTGTCRDFAVLMMEAARCLGLAARFVSGYIYVPSRDRAGAAEHQGGGNTHAWVQIYLPGAGWVEFDPTNGIVGSRDLIRVATVRDPRQAIPLSGSWTGSATDCLGMEVAIQVTSNETDPQ
ncbi:MAG: transglutaminase family protein [Gemmatimonadaceae bacterium]|nr:transglutaminase family protein [Acetobacteraceae bacterium]